MLLSLRSQARAAAIQKSRWIELLQAKKIYMLYENFIYTGRAHVPGARGAQGSWNSGLAGLRARGTQGSWDSGLAGFRLAGLVSRWAHLIPSVSVSAPLLEHASR